MVSPSLQWSEGFCNSLWERGGKAFHGTRRFRGMNTSILGPTTSVATSARSHLTIQRQRNTTGDTEYFQTSCQAHCLEGNGRLPSLIECSRSRCCSPPLGDYSPLASNVFWNVSVSSLSTRHHPPTVVFLPCRQFSAMGSMANRGNALDRQADHHSPLFLLANRAAGQGPPTW